jgi:hypothetical protein
VSRRIYSERFREHRHGRKYRFLIPDSLVEDFAQRDALRACLNDKVSDSSFASCQLSPPLAGAAGQQHYSDGPDVGCDGTQQLFQLYPRLGVVHYQEYATWTDSSDISQDACLLPVTYPLAPPAPIL